MKVIFLDFDGVTNTDQWVRDHAMTYHDNPIDPARAVVLNDLLRRSGAKVVISSTWRKDTSLFGLQLMLAARGIDRSVVIDVTPDSAAPTGMYSTGIVLAKARSFEIQAWLSQHPEVTDYVILDDDLGAEIPGHFVGIDPIHGLQPEHIERALKILGVARELRVSDAALDSPALGNVVLGPRLRLVKGDE